MGEIRDRVYSKDYTPNTGGTKFDTGKHDCSVHYFLGLSILFDRRIFNRLETLVDALERSDKEHAFDTLRNLCNDLCSASGGHKHHLITLAGEVCRFGADKYSRNDYRKGIQATRLVAAATRHMIQWFSGERNDAESGKSHLAHAFCNFMMLSELLKLDYERTNDYAR